MVLDETMKTAKKAQEKKQKSFQEESRKLSDLLQTGVNKASEYGLEKPAAGLAAAISTGHSLLRDPGDSPVMASTMTPKPTRRNPFRKDGKVEVLDSPKKWEDALEKTRGPMGEKMTPEAKMKWLRKVESGVKGYKVPENLPVGKIDEEIKTVKKMLEAEKKAMQGKKK